ncbi:MAG: tetratricopeptide repeat protein [Idiomarina sp.]|nr:tetratricopeptide repeat protein [Idiomarina sp.]
MSLINKMLKDIDQRDRERAENARTTSVYTAGRKPLPAWLLLLTGALSAVLIVYIVLLIVSAATATDSTASRAQEPAPRLAIQHHLDDLVELDSADENAPVTPAPELAADSPQQSVAPVLRPVAEPAPAVEPMPQETQPATEQSPQQRTQQSPELEPVAEAAGEMRVERSQTTPRQLAERRYRQGMADLEAGRHRQGAQQLHEALVLHPEMHDARQELAVYYFSRGFLSDAMRVLEDGLQQFPGQPELLLVQARILERAEQSQAALELLRDIPVRLPQHVDLLILRGALATELEDYELAVITYEALTHWRGDQGRWWLGLAMAREALDDYAGAISAYRRALDDPSLGDSSRSFIYQRKEDLL